MDSGISTIIAAVIGGVATIIATVITVRRHQKKSAEKHHDNETNSQQTRSISQTSSLALNREEKEGPIKEPANKIYYEKALEDIYKKAFVSIKSDSSLQYIYQQAGKAYRDISELNIKYKICDKDSGLDNHLIYLIAGRIRRIDNFYLNELSQEKIAAGIADQIIDYLNTGKKEHVFEP